MFCFPKFHVFQWNGNEYKSQLAQQKTTAKQLNSTKHHLKLSRFVTRHRKKKNIILHKILEMWFPNGIYMAKV